MLNIILAIHVMLAVFLIIVVLMQRSEGGGLGIGGGGNAKTASRGGLDGIGKLTWYLAAGFIATSLTLTIMAANASGTSSTLDNILNQAPKATTEDATNAPALPLDTPAIPNE